MRSALVALWFFVACGPTSSTPPNDGGTEGVDAGQADAGTAAMCVARPVPDDDVSLTHFTHPLIYGVMGPLTVVRDSTLPNPQWPGAEHNINLFRPEGDAAYPVIFYSHPYGGTNPDNSQELFKRLASNGFNVVHVPYQLNDRLKQYTQLWVGFRTAAQHYGAKFDLTKVGFVGHCFGGGASPEMARRAFGAPTENGLTSAWGSAGRMLYIMAPWFSYPGIDSPSTIADNYHQIPDDVRTVIQLFADDDTNDDQIAVKDIWEKLPPTMTDKDFILLRSDQCGTFALNAGHTVPATYNTGGPGTGNNAHDEWAIARRIHALADYAFKGSEAARALAYPRTPEALSLGNWVGMCGDRPVAPLEVSAGKAPIVSSCGGKATGDYLFMASGHCDNSVTGAAGSPPCR